MKSNRSVVTRLYLKISILFPGNVSNIQVVKFIYTEKLKCVTDLPSVELTNTKSKQHSTNRFFITLVNFVQNLHRAIREIVGGVWYLCLCSCLTNCSTIFRELRCVYWPDRYALKPGSKLNSVVTGKHTCPTFYFIWSFKYSGVRSVSALVKQLLSNSNQGRWWSKDLK